MRNLFKVTALPFAIFALSLGVFACGDESDDSGQGAGGDGGSDGNGNNGGTGGTDGTDTRSLDQKICDNWYSDQLAGVQGPCMGFASGGNPIPYAQCTQVVAAQSWTIEEKQCLAETECSQNLGGCVEVPEPPEPPEPTPECNALCEHIYGCGLYFVGGTQANPRQLTMVECMQQCPAQPWADDETVTSCLATFECTEEMSEEEKLEARNECFPDE